MVTKQCELYIYIIYTYKIKTRIWSKSFKIVVFRFHISIATSINNQLCGLLLFYTTTSISYK